MTSDESAVLELSKKIIYSYFKELNLTPLFCHLADDVIWAGAEKDMALTGYEAVAKALRQSHWRSVPCAVDNMEHVVRPLGPETYLCQLSYDIAADPACQMAAHEYLRSLFIFRKTDRRGDGWEIIYLNTSITYNGRHEQELSAEEKALRSFCRQGGDDRAGQSLTAQDRHRLYGYVKRNALKHLDAAGRELFLSLSLYSSFTGSQAAYMMNSPRAKDLLNEELGRNAFLYFDYTDNSFSFHPLLLSYLRYVFSRQSRQWQQAQQSKAARWYLQKGDYKQAVTWAHRSGDYKTVLTTIEQAGRESLYGFPADVAADTLEHASPEERLSHLEGCLYCILYLFRRRKLRLANNYLNRLADWVGQDVDDVVLRRYYEAYIEAARGLFAYPDSAAMTAHLQKAKHLLPAAYEIVLPWTFGSPSPLSLYYRSPGTLGQCLTGLQQLTSSYLSLIHMPSLTGQIDFLPGEYDYLTGHLDAAEQTLTQYVYSNSVAPKSIAHLQTAHFYLARLAVCRGDGAKLQQELRQLQTLKLRVYPQCGTLTKVLCEAFIYSMITAPFFDLQHIYPLPVIDTNALHYPIESVAAVVQDKLLLSRGDMSRLLLQAESNYKAAIASSHILPAIYETILLACVYEFTGNLDNAAAALKQGAVLAQDDGLVMPFAEHAEYLEKTLTRLNGDETVGEFICRVQDLSLAEPLSALRASLVKQFLPLSKREMEIAAMAADGMTNNSIAQQLRIAEITVKKTLSHIYKKLNIANRTALANYISNLTPPPLSGRK